MPMTRLEPKTDYFFCDECQEHVPCVRQQPGVWEIRCPRCAGECAVCNCHLSNYCFGKGNSVRMILAPAAARRQPGKTK
jgi:hypothetical protein